MCFAQFQVKKISKFHKFILRSKHIDYVEMVLLEATLSRFKTSPRHALALEAENERTRCCPEEKNFLLVAVEVQYCLFTQRAGCFQS